MTAHGHFVRPTPHVASGHYLSRKACRARKMSEAAGLSCPWGAHWPVEAVPVEWCRKKAAPARGEVEQAALEAKLEQAAGSETGVAGTALSGERGVHSVRVIWRRSAQVAGTRGSRRNGGGSTPLNPQKAKDDQTWRWPGSCAKYQVERERCGPFQSPTCPR